MVVEQNDSNIVIISVWISMYMQQRFCDFPVIFPWPYENCNKCVQNSRLTAVCNNMQLEVSQEIHIFTFYPESSTVKVDKDSLAIVKVKRTIPYKPSVDGSAIAGGVEFEHMSIRGFKWAECFGCEGTSSWTTIACPSCAEDKKRWLFELDVWSTADEINRDLVLNFEFYIGSRFFCDSTHIVTQ